MYKPNVIEYPLEKDDFKPSIKCLLIQLIDENSKSSQEIIVHCKIIADQQAIIADLMNRVKLLEEDRIKRSCH